MELTECGEKDREGKNVYFNKMINIRTNNPTFLLSGQLTGEVEPRSNVIPIIQK